ncbi:MAG: hypothetical protein HND48_12690 [Chloroflexi bacterium]|nr:hypothetical protein [Chloroflexota bacterium]
MEIAGSNPVVPDTNGQHLRWPFFAAYAYFARVSAMADEGRADAAQIKTAAETRPFTDSSTRLTVNSGF